MGQLISTHDFDEETNLVSTDCSGNEIVSAWTGETNLVSNIDLFGEEMGLAGADEIDVTNLISTDETVHQFTNLISTDGSVHQFNVNYLKMKELSNGQCITSSIFESNGYKWTIHCYPKGIDKDEDNEDVALFLVLLNDFVKLYVGYALAISGKSASQPLIKTSASRGFQYASDIWGWKCFIKRTDLEERFVADDGYFQILCSIDTVDPKFNCTSHIPIGHVKEDIGNLWESGEMADVKFEVEGEIICAHKVILAAQSSVFKAELFRHMAEGNTECIRIENMKPEVFRALLRFIYNNSVDNERDTHLATSVMTQNLLVAATRYAIEGLIIRCEYYLMENLSLDTIIDVLILADRHCLFKLKEACLEFASSQENFIRLSLTDGYIHLAQAYFSLWLELKKKVIE
ncbi:BTB/POZ/MATH-domain protein [Rhynchospora pubera]|uniref:BTB/POZ/MATH-domain protein n=1 Tax=Rhynchospora pubera TaxID=906938 RepID=A0AAV8GXA7_9POAL|nr:BTB/POZ/MATH-domain protein [Rhynchospora pubera]